MSHQVRFPFAVLVLLSLGDGVSQVGASPQNPGKAALKQAQQQKKAAEKAADAQVKLSEAERLKAAYIFLAMANHDYDGFRAKAMHDLQEAARLLDASILKNGTGGQKVLALKEDIAAARAKFLAKHSATVHEPQALSDLQMREGLQLVLGVRPVLVQRKQPRVLAHVDKAIQHINTALKIR
jgi:hypothetical protein